MIIEGAKIKHVKSPNFISEMADQFNLAGLQTGAGGRVAMIIGRDQLDITQETMREIAPGQFQAQTDPEDLIMIRHVIANISIPLESAKALMVALGTAIAQLEQAPTAE